MATPQLHHVPGHDPLFERRHGSIAMILLWVFLAYSAMAVEIWLTSTPKVGLSETTYCLLGAMAFHWHSFRDDKRQFRTGLAMVVLVVFGMLVFVGITNTTANIGHVAHVYGLVVGLALEWITSIATKKKTIVRGDPC